MLGRRRLFGIAKHMLGWTKLELGLYRQAQDLFQMSFALFEEMDEREMMGRSFLGESALALVKENHEAARTWAEKSAAMIQEIGQQSVGSSALRCMAIAALRLGKRCQARALLREALGIALEIRTLTSTIQPIAGTALLLAGAGDAERAVELYALASRYPISATRAGGTTSPERTSRPLPPPCRRTLWQRARIAAGHAIRGRRRRPCWMSCALSNPQKVLGQDMFSAAWAAGEVLTLEEALDVGLD